MKRPIRHTISPLLSAVSLLLALSFSCLGAELNATYSSATDVPATAAGYTASGNTVDFILGFAPTMGTNLTVVRNTGQGFIAGEFDNLANGATVNLDYDGAAYPFVAWYYGGDGNDLVLLWPHTGLAGWGQNNSGQLGDNSTAQRNAPVTPDLAGELAGKTIVQVVRGSSHTLVLTSEGKVYAWGVNSNGQLGDNSTTQRNVPVAVNMEEGTSALSGKTVASIAAGSVHSLALCTDGTLVAWGRNSNGQLGDNSTVQRNVPVAVNMEAGTSALSGKKVTTIAVGATHSLALCTDGTLAAWGYNYNGQLGDNSTTQRNVPVAVSVASGTSVLSGKTVTSIAAGFHHSLALCTDGTLAAWGYNYYGQLGNSSTGQRNAPVAVNAAGALSNKTVESIAGGAQHSLALCTDGTAVAWGYNGYGQLGDNSTAQRTTPGAVNTAVGTSALSGKTVVSIASGAYHSLALCTDGTAVAWGQNSNGQLGDNSTTQRNAPVAVNTVGGTSVLSGASVSALSAGSCGSHSFAIYGTTAPEITLEQPFGTDLTDGSSTVDFGNLPLGGGIMKTFTIRNIGSASLSIGAITVSGADAADFSVNTRATMVGLAAGGSASFTVTFKPSTLGIRSATLHLVNGDGDESSFDIALTGTGTDLPAAVFDAAGDVPFTFAAFDATGLDVELSLDFAPAAGTNLTVVRNTGQGFIKGEFGNLANGAMVNLAYDGSTYPFVVWYYGGDGNDLVLLWPHTGLAAWGYNYNGQLGNNSTAQRNVPVNPDMGGVLAGKTIVQVVRGNGHTLALTSEGKVYGWGRNNQGQLGDNSTTQRNVPVAVNTEAGTSALSGKTVATIAAGSDHNLALCTDGTAVAWGLNSNGQLGDNSTVQRNVPVAVNVAAGTSALSGKKVATIAVGASHSLALCTDGTLAAWGQNTQGQLGDKSSTQRNAPVAVNMAAGTIALSGKTVTAIAGGANHSLALCTDGTLAAWGRNSEGQLGDNSTTQRNAPVAVNTVDGTSALSGKTVASIAAGGSHSLAVCTDGTAVAWGLNSNGQLGDNSTTQRNAPVAVNVADGTSSLFGKTVESVAAGIFHSMALCTDGTLAAWGYNYFGQLGDNSSTQRSSPVAVSTAGGTSVLSGASASALSAGALAYHSIAIYGIRGPEIAVEQPLGTNLTDGSATVDFGSLPLGGSSVRTFTIRNTGGLTLSVGAVSTDGADAAEFSVNASATAAALSAGGSTTFTVTFTPRASGARSAALHLVNGDANNNLVTIALTGTGTDLPAAVFSAAGDVPLTVATYDTYDATGLDLELSLNFAPAAGTNLTVIRNAGQGFITGEFGNMSNGATVNLDYDGSTYPFVVWYYGGDGNDLVLLWPHTVLAGWGQYINGQLGDNSTSQRNDPVLADMGGELAGKTIVQVVRGANHTLALTSEGKVYAWGYNYYGQLGDNSTSQRNAPVAVNVAAGTSALFGKTVVAIAAGGLHSLALCADGTLAAWGYNIYGQLGDNSTVQRNAPVAVNVAAGTSALSGKMVTSITAGFYHSLVLCTDGTLAAWGYNNLGQLGNNSTAQRNAPVAVNVAGALSDKTVTSIEAGTYHSLVLCTDGTLAAWGQNSYGQLGDNSTTQRNVPVAVNVAVGTSALSGKTVASIVAGGLHSLALCSDGTLAAWGYNGQGQLGDNSTVQRNAPVAVNVAVGTSVLSGKTVRSLAAGYNHSLALCADGTLAAWGQNSNGQLGDNSTTQRNVPVAVNMAGGTSVLFGASPSALSTGSVANHSIAIYGISEAEIAVEQPLGTDLTDGSSTVDFGSLPLGGGTVMTFTIRNDGGLALTLGTISISGTDAADFSVTSAPVSSVSPGGSTTFGITFSPRGYGLRNATISLTNNDRNKNPFDFAIQGTGLNQPPVWAGYSVSTPYGKAATVSIGKLLAGASDPEGHSISVTAAGPSANGGTVSLGAGSLTYTPANGFSGADSFPVTLTDAFGASSVGTVNVTVAANSGAAENTVVLTPMTGGKMGMKFQGIPGRSYQVQRSIDMAVWMPLETVVALANGEVSFIDDNPPPGSAFYRVRKP
ncbi:MAG: choice-of-anchor D domain-containing protein [Luteolibacter sp.]